MANGEPACYLDYVVYLGRLRSVLRVSSSLTGDYISIRASDRGALPTGDKDSDSQVFICTPGMSQYRTR